MRYLNGVFVLLLLYFIAVQFNDPDGPLWMAIYLVPTMWCALAVVRPIILTRVKINRLLLVSIVTAIAATVYYWPKSSRWWSIDVWMDIETAREGMGMMIVTIMLGTVWLSGKLLRRRQSHEQLMNGEHM